MEAAMAAARELFPITMLPTLTPQEYLRRERGSSDKHEYIDGLVVMMAGARENHVLIVGNVVQTLGIQMRERPCKAYSSDMKVRMTPTTYAYPDVAALCGAALFEDEEHDVLLNPQVIIEVLSSLTEGYDRGLKFRRYQNLPWLQEYILISQETPRVERFLRQPDGQWLLLRLESLSDVLQLPTIGCTLLLADVYDKVAFEG
jgi:Uma2 family endonuclease